MDRLILFANPGTPRCVSFVREHEAYCQARGIASELRVVPWVDVIRHDGRLEHLPELEHPATVRLDSPGKSPEAYLAMLRAGERAIGGPNTDWASIDLPRALILRPGLWFQGWKHVLNGLSQSLAAMPHLRPTAAPEAIATMFDKNRTLAVLRSANIPVPDWIDAIPAHAGELLEQTRRWPQTYVKLVAGSSATGLVLLNRRGEQLDAWTTIHWHRGRPFNSRRLERLDGTRIVDTLQFLLDEGATIQQGWEKSLVDGQNIDVRVVCLDRRPIAQIFRRSPGPITNLYLGGSRGDEERCRAAIPKRTWLDALGACVAASEQFESRSVGIDLMFDRNHQRHAILEVNAFGDFFPGWRDQSGRSIHQRWLESVAGNVGDG